MQNSFQEIFDSVPTCDMVRRAAVLKSNLSLENGGERRPSKSLGYACYQEPQLI
jgi:hypothetical protein